MSQAPGRASSLAWFDHHVRPFVPRDAQAAVEHLCLVVLNPDAVYRRLVGPILGEFAGHGFAVVSVDVVEAVPEAQLEELYRFDITRNNDWNDSAVWWMNRQVFGLGPLVLVHLVPKPRRAHAFEAVDALKEEIRLRFEATNRNLALLHTADGWADSARESLIFSTFARWLAVARRAARCWEESLEWSEAELAELDVALDYPVASLALEDVCAAVAARAAIWRRAHELWAEGGPAPADAPEERIRPPVALLHEPGPAAAEREAAGELLELARRWPPVTIADLARFEELGRSLGFALREWERLVLLTSTRYGAKYVRRPQREIGVAG